MLRINPALLNMVDKTKNTPLHYAASSGKLEVVKSLIKKRANLQAKNMGKAINIKDAIISCPYVSPDGKFLFFVRQQTGVFEYCWVSTKIIEELKPTKKI